MSTSGSASSIGRKALVGVPAALAVASGVYALFTRWQGQPPILCAIFGLLAVLIGFVTIRAVTDMPTVLRIVAIAGTVVGGLAVLLFLYQFATFGGP